MKKFVTLSVEYGSVMDIALEKIIIKQTNEHLGVGSRLVDVRSPRGDIKIGCNLSITLNNNKEEIVSLDGEIIPTEFIPFNEYCFHNSDF